MQPPSVYRRRTRRNPFLGGLVLCATSMLLAACAGDVSDLSQTQVRDRYHATSASFDRAIAGIAVNNDVSIAPGPINIASVPPNAPQSPQWQRFGTISQCGADLCFTAAAGGSAQRLVAVRNSYGAHTGYDTATSPSLRFYKGHVLGIGPSGGRALASWYQTDAQLASATRGYGILRDMVMTQLQNLADREAKRQAEQTFATAATVVGGVATAVTPTAANMQSAGSGSRTDPPYSDEIFCLTPANVMTSCR